MNTTVILLVAGTLVLGACTGTMNKDECRTVDWRTVGYEDGVAGYAGDRIGQHRKACAAAGVTPDLDAYRAGRDDGLREYCQPHVGYRAGSNGAAYYDTCPADLEPAFVAAYESGRELYVRERRVANADAGIANRRHELERLEDTVARKAFQVLSETATPEERAKALLDARQIAERMGRLKAEIAALEKDRARYAQELEHYRMTADSVS
jgi:hypothetical protein